MHWMLLFALALGGTAGQSSALLPAGETCAVAAGGSAGIDGDLERYRTRLVAVRAGERDAGNELMGLAAHLAAEHGRADCADVARYYLALTPAELEAGRADEAVYNDLHREVNRIGDDERSRLEWQREYQRIAEELVRHARAVAVKADYVPAAQSYALASRLIVELAERAGAEREELLARASELASEAIALFDRAGQVTRQLEPLWVEGRVERARGRVGESRRLLERCAELASEVRQPEFEEHALFGLVALARDRGDVHEIDRLLARVAEITTPAQCWPLAREHASRLLHCDRPESALSVLDRHPPQDASRHDEWRAFRSAACLRIGDLAAARREIEAMREEPHGETAILATAAIDLADGAARSVIDDLEGTDVMRGFSWLGRAQAASLLGDAYLAERRYDDAVAVLEQALELTLHWTAQLEEDSTGSVVGEWLGLHTVGLLAEALVRAGEELRAACVIEALQSLGLRGDRAAELEPSALLGWAARYELGLVTWCVGADHTVAVHVAQDGSTHALLSKLGRAEIERGVQRLRDAATTGGAARAGELARELSDTLLPPELAAAIAGASRDDRLLFLLHGPLERLPVALLGPAEEWLGAHCTPLVLPGLPDAAPSNGVHAAMAAPRLVEASAAASDSVDASERSMDASERSGDASERSGEARAGDADAPPARRWRLLGAPTSVAGSTVLPGAARELDALSRADPAALLASGDAFTREELADALRAGDPLHLATHLVPSEACGGAAFAPVALLLAGGEHFCAGDVRALEPRLPLVVLATCESGGGRLVDGEGLNGLARAFLESGTTNLLVTLWPVEDGAAARASELFHHHLRAGERPSAAARAMIATLIREGTPLADWSAYRFLGSD